MIALAYAECGLNLDQFFALSFYEWSLELHKVRVRKENEFEKWEGNAVFVRDILAMIINTTPRKNPQTFKGSDFYKLSFDKKEVNTEPSKEPLAKFPKKIKG